MHDNRDIRLTAFVLGDLDDAINFATLVENQLSPGEADAR